jgi:hypothetical protein
MLDVGSPELVERHALVRLRRCVGGLPPYVGLVLAASERLVLLRDVDGDRLGGFTVLSRDSIEGARWNWMLRYAERIVHDTAGHGPVDPPFAVDLTSWTALFRSLEHAGIRISAEHEHPRRFRYMTGRIIHVNGATVSLRWPRSLPAAERETERMRFAEITRVAFA